MMVSSVSGWCKNEVVAMIIMSDSHSISPLLTVNKHGAVPMLGASGLWHE
jgi:hypothetical protein